MSLCKFFLLYDNDSVSGHMGELRKYRVLETTSVVQYQKHEDARR